MDSPALVMAPGAPPAERFDWCYNSAADLNASAIDTGTKCEQQLPFCVSSEASEKLLDRHGDGVYSLGRRIAAESILRWHTGEPRRRWGRRYRPGGHDEPSLRYEILTEILRKFDGYFAIFWHI